VSFTPGRAELEKNTPHHCVVEEGILLGAMAALTIPVVIEQPRCFRRGAPACTFIITSSIVDRRWGGSSPNP
jgi:predicted hydrocarbon binding protein